MGNIGPLFHQSISEFRALNRWIGLKLCWRVRILIIITDYGYISFFDWFKFHCTQNSRVKITVWHNGKYYEGGRGRKKQHLENREEISDFVPTSSNMNLILRIRLSFYSHSAVIVLVLKALVSHIKDAQPPVFVLSFSIKYPRHDEDAPDAPALQKQWFQ